MHSTEREDEATFGLAQSALRLLKCCFSTRFVDRAHHALSWWQMMQAFDQETPSILLENEFAD